ncbi:MAG: isoprenylcysteine carboxylmethyltransferase family protein [Acidobacteria bacterium]|nr:isoprenylcysteine carboxylmethyltransferase family protein [Acidobacteriota bacterium]
MGKTTVSVVLRLFWWVLMIFGGAVLCIYLDVKRHNLFFSLPFHLTSFFIGLIVTKLAFAAAATGGRELKKGRSENTPRLETDKIVTTGIYSCMRHPMLFGLTLLPLGWALLLGSPHFIFFLAPVEILTIIVMVFTLEEAECRKKFGAEYLAYKKQVPAVSLRAHCLKWLFTSKPGPSLSKRKG